ncbi:MAG: gluconate 2-dehydrogenase flavoprotein precursor, partial [Roseomonas sp.]|nr:gluconate 2-dehydrogenase flavoprotein precursor [Roseomonas sp.]
REWEQPADLVLLCANGLFNVRLLMLSGIGKQYAPVTGEGTLGRNYAYQTNAGSVGYFDKAPTSTKHLLQPFHPRRLARHGGRRLQWRRVRPRAAGLTYWALDAIKPVPEESRPAAGAGMRRAPTLLAAALAADLATYIRNSWGNAAPAMPADAVRKMRDVMAERPR